MEQIEAAGAPASLSLVHAIRSPPAQVLCHLERVRDGLTRRVLAQSLAKGPVAGCLATVVLSFSMAMLGIFSAGPERALPALAASGTLAGLMKVFTTALASAAEDECRCHEDRKHGNGSTHPERDSPRRRGQ
ncbi:hypothetical protein AOC05_12145 [Arthrobacter alpinus]|uniref:Uncharacterized protein n=1 Tax=Arthrobacter alpinus TaxID=656366 RepID=A0A0M5LXL2_9MICC|nr:hypothetical protein AOC05_12145 [Arthrobacter alpinus]